MSKVYTKKDVDVVVGMIEENNSDVEIENKKGSKSAIRTPTIVPISLTLFSFVL